MRQVTVERAERLNREGKSVALIVGVALATILLWGGAAEAEARAAPFSFADLVEKLSPAVVNISTTQEVKAGSRRQQDVPVPPGSPFEDFFKEY